MADPMLHLAGVSKAFGALVVSDDITLDVAGGACHAIIGPNGAGKTTLMNLITGHLNPDSGTIRFDGRDITTLPAHKRPGLGLARSFQITAIIPGFTVLENAALASQSVQGGTFSRLGRASSDTAINDNALAALSAVGLVDSAERVAGTLAHGEKRALELAMALALKPKLMLLDEPMAGTGRDETNRMIALLETVKAQATVVLVEHDMSAVFALADTISVLDQGRIIATGAPEAIRNDAAVKAAYLGEDSP